MEQNESDETSTLVTQQLVWKLRALVLQRSDTLLDLDLSMAQLRALMFIRVAQPITIGELATRMHQRLASASALVDRLLRGGLVVRAVDPLDRRRANVSLAPHGEQLLREIDERAAQRFRALLERMSPAGLRALTQALDELVGLAQQPEKPDEPTS